MTTGQRIAQKRKEQGLSQEALGEQLGVSRQSVYKWESDTTLPEIDKLVAMSRIFSVSVGWLLGAEEDPAASQTQAGETPDSGELTEKQLKMVEEIVDRYIAAQPKPSRKRWWLYLAAALAVFLVFGTLSDRLDRVSRQYSDLQNSVFSVRSDVNSQIYDITSRVEEILKSQNSLTADYGTEILTADLAENTVTFRAWATPKTYVEGMTAIFQADAGDGIVEAVGELGPGREFSAEVTCTLTDSITLSVVFVDGDKGETQVLYTYPALYSCSFPEATASHQGSFAFMELDDRGSITFEEECVMVYGAGPAYSGTAGISVAEVETIRVGLFRNKELVRWLEPGDPPEGHGVLREATYYWLRDLTITPKKDEVYCFATVVTDEYGREQAYESFPRGTLQEWPDGEWEFSNAGDTELTAATGLTVEEWWDLPWKYE